MRVSLETLHSHYSVGEHGKYANLSLACHAIVRLQEMFSI